MILFEITLYVLYASSLVFGRETCHGKICGQTQNCKQLDSFDSAKYYSYNDIVNFMKMLSSCDKRFKLQEIGETYEGNRLYMILASEDATFSYKKPAIMVDGGAHAREWAAIAAVVNLLWDLHKGSSGLLQLADWFVIPVVNPDGYEYTRNTDRLWRKNRSQQPGTSCYGTDLNRNYGFHWSESGTSRNPCDPEVYPGPYAFSEPETTAIQSVMLNNNDVIKLYVTIHAFGQYMVYPYGYTGQLLPNRWRELDRFARNVTGEVKKLNGHEYKVMSAGQWYPGAGGSDDYAFGAANIPYAYTVELTKGYEFKYPENKLPELLKESSTIFKSAAILINLEFGDKNTFYL